MEMRWGAIGGGGGKLFWCRLLCCVLFHMFAGFNGHLALIPLPLSLRGYDDAREILGDLVMGSSCTIVSTLVEDQHQFHFIGRTGRNDKVRANLFSVIVLLSVPASPLDTIGRMDGWWSEVWSSSGWCYGQTTKSVIIIRMSSVLLMVGHKAVLIET